MWKFILLTNRIFLQKLTSLEDGLKKENIFALRPSAKRESCTVFGALNLKTQSFYWKSAHEGNTESFISFLRQVISNSKGRKSIIIADNVSYHKSGKTRTFLSRNNLDIIYLPPYSPEFNPIEQVWKWSKPLVNGISTLKKGVPELLGRFRKICWHWRYGRLHNPLKVGLGIWHTCYNYL